MLFGIPNVPPDTFLRVIQTLMDQGDAKNETMG